MKELEDKVAVITGGGSGLGRELALGCARRGMKLVLADVDESGMQETVTEVEKAAPGTGTATMKVDVSRLEDVEALANLAKERFGGAHLLFNNAGVGINAPIWENTVGDWNWVLGVNLYGVAWGIKVFAPIMLEQGEGHIVNTASAAGWMNMAGSGIYNVSKCSVVAMSETLANDIKDVGGNVGVSCLSPAFFPTPIIESERNRPAEHAETAPDSEARRKREEQLRQAVTKGKLSAEEVAEITIKAVEANQFYIFPHQKIKQLILARAEAVQDEKTAFDPTAGR
ncbi:SDR family NAD(P)-dependent oxidoreductase [Ectothiorhodospiraceae bacterium WFHF3C12]|nr:SDR family NAD(P)-dependent oxidoreductase [Ectothiorhodospiraceae bacterium WFHF3C12]